jgi:ubiquinone biosynthesis protein
MARSPVRSIRHLQRYREIASVLIQHGFGGLVETLDLAPYLSLPRRILRRGRPTEPPLGTPQRLRLALEELGPTFVKLGQALSTRPDLLPTEYIAELTKLQDTVPPIQWDLIQEQIEAELGAPLDTVFAKFRRTPIAAASLAQVHAASLPDGSQVVVKVQRPNIATTIETDLEILSDLSRLLEARTSLGQIYDLPGIAAEFATTLRAELDFCREGINADRFRANFSDEPFLHIPQVHWDFTTRRVLVLERIRGIKIDNLAALDAAGYDRYRIATHAARMIIKEVLEDGFFHADPHPGNFLVMPGEIIGAMDFGMVGYLSQGTRTDLIRLYIAAVQADEEGIVDQLIRMGLVRGSIDRVGLRRDVSRLLRKYHGLQLGAFRASDMIEEIMPVTFRHHLHLPADLWLVSKTVAMMEGVALKLAPDLDVVEIARPYVRRFVWQLASPDVWGLPLIKGATDWAELLGLIPRVGAQLLTRAEQGEMQVTVNLKELDQALTRIDRSANRLSVSVLLAALTIGLALLVPMCGLTEQFSLAAILLVAGFIGASLLGLWLIVSILRSGK